MPALDYVSSAASNDVTVDEQRLRAVRLRCQRHRAGRLEVHRQSARRRGAPPLRDQRRRSTARCRVDNVGDGFTIDRATTGIVISESKADENPAAVSACPGGRSPTVRRPWAPRCAATATTRSSNSTASDNGAVRHRGGGRLQHRRPEQHDRRPRHGDHGERSGRADLGHGQHRERLRPPRRGPRRRRHRVDGHAATWSRARRPASTSATPPPGQRQHHQRGRIPRGVARRRGRWAARWRSTCSPARVPAPSTPPRSDGDITVRSNNTAGWSDTTPWYFWFKKLLQPMTALWAVLHPRARPDRDPASRYGRKIEHPYAHQMAHHNSPWHSRGDDRHHADRLTTDLWRQSTAMRTSAAG